MTDSKSERTTNDEKLEKLGGGWAITGGHLTKRFKFPDFISALAFVNKVGDVAEAQGHHPNISFTWGRVDFEIWTHDSDSLTDADFKLARSIESLADS